MKRAQQNNSSSTSSSNKKARTLKGQATLPFLPKKTGAYLSACIEKWNLQPPYQHVNKDSTFWKDYYLERSLLDFRQEHSFKESGHELPQKNRKLQFTEAHKKEWNQISSSVKSTDATDLPSMPPICTESYAADGYHESKTAKGEFLDFHKQIRDEVAKTLKGTDLPPKVKTAASQSVYILDYWINWEDIGDARTVEVTTRFYSPLGNGQSVDLLWKRHFRQRFSCNGELFSFLNYKVRDGCDVKHPCKPAVGKESTTLAELECTNSFSEDDEEIQKSLAGVSKSKELSEVLFGDTNKLSKRKVLALLARSSGAFHIGGVGSWIYKLIRDRLELHPHEKDDDKEQEFDDCMDGW